MRFICVNAGKPREGQEPSYCTICCTAIGKSYVRDLQTRLIYHNHLCLDAHIAQSEHFIERYAREVS